MTSACRLSEWLNRVSSHSTWKSGAKLLQIYETSDARVCAALYKSCYFWLQVAIFNKLQPKITFYSKRFFSVILLYMSWL